MRRPGTDFEIQDNSGNTDIDIVDTAIKPLYLAVSSFDKGPERMMTVSGTDFYKLFGRDISFAKHGQPAIQAANSINAGAELLIKRLVAKDAELANLVIVAEITSNEVNKTDADGNQIYIDADTQQETTDSNGGANEAAKTKQCVIKYDVKSISGAKTVDDVKAEIASLYVEGGTTTPDEGDPVVTPTQIPLFVITDNGRGVSSKRIKFSVDYTLSKNIGFPMYSLTYLGALKFDYEYVRFALKPNTTYLQKNMTLAMVAKSLVQINAFSCEEYYDKFAAAVSEASGIEVDDLVNYDLLFGKDLKGNATSQIMVDEEGYDLSSDYGLMLQNGSNGSFGDAPFWDTKKVEAVGSTPEYPNAWTQAACEFFDGTFDENIFDRDMYKIEVCVDANYPTQVKRSIESLLEFREDFAYFRDCGTADTSYDTILATIYSHPAKNKFVFDYCQYYDIIDDFSGRQVTVTIGYSIARLLVSHLNNNRTSPFCGVKYGVTIPEAIEGTINFIPKHTPKYDQPQLCTDNHINYANYINGVLTLALQLTSQEKATQCSHIHSILAIQDLMRDIRTRCPLSRYSLISGGSSSGMNQYAKDVEEVISKHDTGFKSISFEWTADEIQLANNIFNATIIVSGRPYVQSEKFVICTID